MDHATMNSCPTELLNNLTSHLFNTSQSRHTVNTVAHLGPGPPPPAADETKPLRRAMSNA
eukprot:9220599-Alexandrium_andersonii.AAC.1